MNARGIASGACMRARVPVPVSACIDSDLWFGMYVVDQLVAVRVVFGYLLPAALACGGGGLWVEEGLCRTPVICMRALI